MKETINLKSIADLVEISDGYHTFTELYEHRVVLFIALCKAVQNDAGYGYVWCSTKHSDGTSFRDWFILGVDKRPGNQITYHLPRSYWKEVTEFAEVLPQAPEFDGHTSQDVLERLKRF